VAEDIRLWSCRSPKIQTELEQWASKLPV
jgi:hypothetical protein